MAALDAASQRADELKDDANRSLQEDRPKEALSLYTQAIQVKPSAVLYANRAAAQMRIGRLQKAIEDCDAALELDAGYAKAYYRKARALCDDKQYDAADRTLDKAFDAVPLAPCVDTQQGREASFRREKERDALEKLRDLVEQKRDEAKGAPTIKHFELREELGTGNYSSVYEVLRKSDGSKFALKLVEKAQIDKIKRRHPNVNNEVKMEKAALKKLSADPHPSIILLHATFQDYATLYFLLELCPGGEMWSRTLNSDGSKAGVPACYSLAQCWIAELVDAVEHVHSHDLVHRDIKPENLMLNARGHVKLIDFGTSKDLENDALNGPEFVGTPEYMSPEAVDSKNAGVASDLWSIGVVAHVFLSGLSPFRAQSPYFTFLKIRRGNAADRFPSCIRLSPALGFIDALLKIDPLQRLGAASARGDLSALRATPFLRGEYSAAHPKLRCALPPTRVGTLAELALRALGDSLAVRKTDAAPEKRLAPSAVKEDGRPYLTPLERATLKRYVERLGALQKPHVHKHFFDSPVDARALKADKDTLAYLGCDFKEQSLYEAPTAFCLLGGPRVGFNDAEAELAQLGRATRAINRLRPPLVVVVGTFAQGDATNLTRFRKAMARVSEAIPVAYVCSINDAPTPLALDAWEALFGTSFYCLWRKGARFVVLNSALYEDAFADDPRRLKQERFLEEELEVGKVGQHANFVVMHRPPFSPQSLSGEALVWARTFVNRRVDGVLCGCGEEPDTRSRITSKDTDDTTKPKKMRPLVCPKGDLSDSSSYEDDSDKEEKVCKIVNAPPVSGGFGDDEPVPPGLVLVTCYESHFAAKFHELEALPAISGIAERPPPFKWMD